MKPKKSSLIKAAEIAALTHQLQALNFKSLGDYKNWCVTNGFSTKMEKTNEQYTKEVIFYKKEKYIVRSMNESKKPNIKRMLKNFVDSLDEDKPTDLPEGYVGLNSIRESYYLADETKKKHIQKFLNNAITFANLLEDVCENKKFINLLVDVVNLNHLWVRPINEWKCRSHNTYRQFTSLLRHIFVLYEMPAFIDKAWIKETPSVNGSQKYRTWYLHLGKGLNARNLPDLSIPFTKRMAHFFMEAPENYEPNEAIRYGQVLSLGGTPLFVETLRGTQICTNFSNEDFWESVIRWFIAQPMFDYSQHVGPVIDFINNQKFVPRNLIENGVVKHLGAAQPGFSMKGRDAEPLLRQVELWHNQLGREKKSGNLAWEHQKFIADLEMVEGVDGTPSRKIWKIRELCSSGQLQ
jgi:hypothetical protein